MSQGLQIFLPLSPKDVLVLSDSAVYKVGGRKLKVMDVDVTHEPDVDALNMVQVMNADAGGFVGAFSWRRSDRRSAGERGPPCRVGQAIL